MSCRAEVFTRGEQEKIAIPINAIRTEEDNDANIVKSYVFRVKDNKAEKVFVELGISDDDFQEVNSGIVENDLIVIGPDKLLRHLKDGESVTVEEKNEKSDVKSDES